MLARLPDDVIYCVQLRIKCGESSTAIHKAIKGVNEYNPTHATQP